MKKTIVILVAMLIMAVVAWAGGQKESKTLTLSWLTNPMPAANGIIPQELAVTEFQAKYPDVQVKYLKLDLSDGSTMTMDALIEARMAPDVYDDFMGRVSKYITPAFALDLGAYLKDLDDYLPGILKSVTRESKIYGLPMPGGYQGMMVNLDFAAQLGADASNIKTIEQFLIMAQKIKGNYKDHWVTGLFAGNQSGDYLWMNWFASFGTEMYAPDYKASTVNSPQGVRTMNFLKNLHSNGYVPKEAAVLTDDDYVLQVGKGQFLMTAFYPVWMPTYFKVLRDQGETNIGYEYKFMRFPAAESVDIVPVCGSFPGIVVKRSAEERRNKAAAALAGIYNGPHIQEFLVNNGLVYANRKSVQIDIDNPYWHQIDAVVRENGYYDLGLALPTFSEIRAQMYPLLQKLLAGSISAEEVVQTYQKKVNAILAEM